MGCQEDHRRLALITASPAALPGRLHCDTKYRRSVSCPGGIPPAPPGPAWCSPRRPCCPPFWALRGFPPRAPPPPAGKGHYHLQVPPPPAHPFFLPPRPQKKKPQAQPPPPPPEKALPPPRHRPRQAR